MYKNMNNTGKFRKPIIEQKEDAGFNKLKQLIDEHHSDEFSIRRSSPEEDYYDHIDGYITFKKCSDKRFEGKEFSFDVKETKKKNRSDENVCYDYIILEVQGVSGLPGSLYGKQQYFIFEHKNSWLVVQRQKLVSLIKENVDTDSFILKTREVKEIEPYVQYRREDSEKYGPRNDRVVYVPFDDIMPLVGCRIDKV